MEISEVGGELSGGVARGVDGDEDGLDDGSVVFICLFRFRDVRARRTGPVRISNCQHIRRSDIAMDEHSAGRKDSENKRREH